MSCSDVDHEGHQLGVLTARTQQEAATHPTASAGGLGHDQPDRATTPSSPLNRSNRSSVSNSPHFSQIGGGYNQDHEFFGYRQSI